MPYNTMHTCTIDVLSFVLSYQCCVYVLFTCWCLWCFSPTCILFLTRYICLHSPCNLPVFFFTCDIVCLYHVVHTLSLHTPHVHAHAQHMYAVCLWSTMCLIVLLLPNKNGSLVQTFCMHAWWSIAVHQAVRLWQSKASHLCCMCMTCDTLTPGHPSTADEAWYWPKHVLHIGRLELRAVCSVGSCGSQFIHVHHSGHRTNRKCAYSKSIVL